MRAGGVSYFPTVHPKAEAWLTRWATTRPSRPPHKLTRLQVKYNIQAGPSRLRRPRVDRRQHRRSSRSPCFSTWYPWGISLDPARGNAMFTKPSEITDDNTPRPRILTEEESKLM